MSEQTRCTLAKANELALMSSERIRRSLELLGPRRRAAIRTTGESVYAGAARQAASATRRSAPPPSGA
jgi:hypothetical protein